MELRKEGMMLFGLAAVLVVGCAGSTEDEMAGPALATNGLDANQSVTYSGWTANALKPYVDSDPYAPYVQGSATFSGPAGQTFHMGVCLLKMTSTACSGTTQAQIDAQCAGATGVTASPDAYGQTNYCVAPNATGSKRCAFRPGSQAQLCAGSPALSGHPAIAAGTYATPSTLEAGSWISYACFNGCTGDNNPPSSSSVAVALSPKQCGGPGQPICP